MKKIVSVILLIMLTISMCSGTLYADEVVFEGEAVEFIEEETVFEDASNWDEGEYVSDDSIITQEESVSEDSYLTEYVWDDQGEEVVASDDAAIRDNNGDFTLSVVDDNVSINDLYKYTISGSSLNKNITLEKTDEGIKITGDNLTNLVVTGENASKTEKIDVSTTDDSAVITNNNGELVVGEAGSIILDTNTLTMDVGATMYLKATVTGASQTVTWSSSDESVATVKNGKVTGIKAGTAIITAEASGKKASCEVTVINSKIIDSGKCGPNLTWKYVEGTLTISGSGEMEDFYPGPAKGNRAPWRNLYEISINKVILCDGVTSIGKGAFSGCENLTSIIIPNSVTSIGNFAFFGVTDLTSITIPDSVTSIGHHAFYACDNLTSIKVPDGVTSIGYYTFGRCFSLTNITLPNSVTSIGDYAFSDCNELTSIIIPDGVTAIGRNAFEGCSSLSSITIPDSVTSIGDDAFTSWNKLKIYGVKGSYAEKYAEDNGVPFVSISDPRDENPEVVDSGRCGKNLTWKLTGEAGNMTLTISGIGEMEDYTSSRAPWYGYCLSIVKVILPEGLNTIGEYAFDHCSSLTNIDIPNSVMSIGYYAFGYYPNLTICGYSGSYAEKYAKQNNIPFESLDPKPSITVSDLSLSKTKVTLYTPGAAKTKSFTLKAFTKRGKITSVSFKSSNTSVVTVNKSSGKVKTKKAGTATITATVKANNGSDTITKKLTCKVTVKKPSLTVTPTSVTLKKGKNKTLTVKTAPSATVTYTSSNKKIATVSNKGKITAKKKGTCKITVKCNSITKTVKVTVI